MFNVKKDPRQSVPNARGFNENGGKSCAVNSPCIDNSLYPLDKRSTASWQLECLFASGHTANPPSTVPTAAKQTFRRSRRKDTYPFALIIDIIRSMALMRIMSRVLCEGQIACLLLLVGSYNGNLNCTPASGRRLPFLYKSGKTQTN